MRRIPVVFVLAVCGSIALAQQSGTQTGRETIPETDTSALDAQGTAHVTRVVPVPQTISPEAQKFLSRQISDAAHPETLAEQRNQVDAWQTRAGAAMKAVYPANVAAAVIAGVPVRVITPMSIPAEKRDRVLINVHGGGFHVDSGSLTESIPMANLTQTKVVSVLYRLSPEHSFPAAVDDAVAVYKELLKTHKPQDMALYGTSAGAILTTEIAVRLKQLGLPLPAALGVFSGLGDFTRDGDSWAMYSLQGLSGHLNVPQPADGHDSDYVGSTNKSDPVLSPLFADVHGFPPTLFITSTRDLLLSGTTTLQRHFYESGVESPLIVFEGLPHAFWNDVSLPESREALKLMAEFMDKQVGH